MNAVDRVIRLSTALAVLGVAAVVAVASYEHPYDLVRAHGEAGWTARLVPLTVDGLIHASSMVMLDSARRKRPVPRLAQLGLGIAATLAANVAHGLGWPGWRGDGSVARSCPGRFIRAGDDNHSQFPGSGGQRAQARARHGSAAGTGG
jgi:uncharacterized protein DUF2637